MEGCSVLADGLAFFLLTMALLFPNSHAGKAFSENTNKEPKPTAADDSDNVWSHVEVAFALIGVGTIVLVGLLLCCCNRSRGCDRRNQRSHGRERSVSVIHITNNTTSNCVILERPPSYCDAMSTPERPPPPYPGFGLENIDIGRYHCQRTPPPAYHNMAFDTGSADVLSSSTSAGTATRRSSSFRSRDTVIHGESAYRVETLIRTDTGSRVDQNEGRENEGFLHSDNNNGREPETSTRPMTVSNSSRLVVPLQEASHDPHELRVIIPMDQDSDTLREERRDENSSECSSLGEERDQNISNSSSFRDRQDENGSDAGENEPMVGLREVSRDNDSRYRDSATSETGLLRE